MPIAGRAAIGVSVGWQAGQESACVFPRVFRTAGWQQIIAGMACAVEQAIAGDAETRTESAAGEQWAALPQGKRRQRGPADQENSEKAREHKFKPP